MAFKSNSGKKSGICRDCGMMPDVNTGDCACGKAETHRLLGLTTSEMSTPYECTSCGRTISHKWAQLEKSSRNGLCKTCDDPELGN